MGGACPRASLRARQHRAALRCRRDGGRALSGDGTSGRAGRNASTQIPPRSVPPSLSPPPPHLHTAAIAQHPRALTAPPRPSRPSPPSSPRPPLPARPSPATASHRLRPPPQDLADFIVSQPRGRLEETDTRRLFRHLLSALRHAHARGFLHGDLKPANVRLRERQDGSGLIGSAVLVDWGMARRIDDRKTSLQMGTPLYASPEQLTGYSADQALGRGRLGAAADVWSLGVTLYEMLVGRPPFAGDTHEKLTSNVLGLNYELPDWLSMEARQLIDSILQTLACDRATVEEVCEDAWTVHDEGPMPPMKPADTTRYKGGGTDGAARDVESGRSGSPLISGSEHCRTHGERGRSGRPCTCSTRASSHMRASRSRATKGAARPAAARCISWQRRARKSRCTPLTLRAPFRMRFRSSLLPVVRSSNGTPAAPWQPARALVAAP